MERYLLVQQVLYDLRRHTEFVNRVGERQGLWPMLDYSRFPADITLQKPIHNSNAIAVIVPLGVPRPSTDKGKKQECTETLVIPWRFALEYFKANPIPELRLGFHASPYYADSRETTQITMEGQSEDAEVVTDELDVLRDAAFFALGKKLDRKKHIWDRIEELTAEVRKPENWPFRM